jgi:3-oxoadipate enol-lactonase
MAEAVAALLDSLGEAGAHVVGLSLGGAVGLQLAVDYPSRVRSLTAVNTFARLRLGPGGFRRGLDRGWLALTGHMDLVGERVAEGLFPGPELEAFRGAAAARLSGNSSRTYFRLLTSVARFDLRPRLGSIRAPTLVVAGERDTTVALSAKAELAGHIPNARLVIIPESGHATPLDSVDAFNRLLLAFLAEVDGDGAQRREASRRVAPRGGSST